MPVTRASLRPTLQQTPRPSPPSQFCLQPGSYREKHSMGPPQSLFDTSLARDPLDESSLVGELCGRHMYMSANILEISKWQAGNSCSPTHLSKGACACHTTQGC